MFSEGAELSEPSPAAMMALALFLIAARRVRARA